MKQFDIYKAPEHWGEITIEQLIKLQSITEGGDIETTIKTVEVFNPDINVMGGDFSNLIQTATAIYDVISKAPTGTQETSVYTIDGQEYRIMEADKIDVSQFIDVNALNENEAEKIKNLPLIISILTENRPTDVKEWAQTIQKNVSVSVAMGVLVFFSVNLEKYLKSTPYYSQILKQIQTSGNGKA